MKVDYEVRALKFAKVLVALFANCATYYDFVAAVELYNKTHTRKLCYASGVSRFAVMRADYVIKFDMAPEAGWEDGRAGNNDTELQVYETAVADGMEYLLAKTTPGNICWRKPRLPALATATFPSCPASTISTTTTATGARSARARKPVGLTCICATCTKVTWATATAKFALSTTRGTPRARSKMIPGPTA